MDAYTVPPVLETSLRAFACHVHACCMCCAVVGRRPVLQILKQKRMYESQRETLYNQQFNMEQTRFTVESMQVRRNCKLDERMGVLGATGDGRVEVRVWRKGCLPGVCVCLQLLRRQGKSAEQGTPALRKVHAQQLQS